jgi:hypothetical protein
MIARTGTRRIGVLAEAECGFSPMPRGGHRGTIAATEGGLMAVFWASVTIAFVVAVLAFVAFATFKVFGGDHSPQH